MSQREAKETTGADQRTSFVISVPGRTEMAGNHQDHQAGCVIASAVDRRIVCRATASGNDLISVESDAQPSFVLDLAEEDFSLPHLSERFSTKALVRGMAAHIKNVGYDLVGCHLSFTSDIPLGMGLSSSAAFELCAGAALLAVAGYEVSENGQVTPLQLARMALHAERDFFGKPCGIMDQTACALGGVLFLDFTDPENPVATPLELPSSWSDYAYLLVQCATGHQDSTDDFSQVATSMERVASFLGLDYLGRLALPEFLDEFTQVREALGDTAALRALGFYRERIFVRKRSAALTGNDMSEFLRVTTESARNSAELLKNVSIPHGDESALIAQTFCEMALDEASDRTGETPGSARIHGGGFGGTVQVIVPQSSSRFFKERIEELLGADCCLDVELGAPGIQILPGD